MENGETYEGIAAAFAKAKAEKQREESQGLKDGDKAAEKRGEMRFTAAHGLLIGFFTWILIIHVIGIYLFTTGFLLTRLVLDDRSECGIPPAEIDSVYTTGSYDEGCWHPRTFRKAVVVIVDALRYDFTIPFPPEGSTERPHHYHNAIPIFHETAVNEPHKAFLLPFIADPPTTTLQRLKGLTTGTLPTFIDAGSNFAGTAIDEDNLVAQLFTAGKRIVHLGDDTWHALFPGYFDANLTRPYDSFNVWDLHTLDNGVNEHIFPLMHPSNSSQWDIIFGHYLGVDHAGHRYGPDHPAMTAKLQQMDGVFRDLMKNVDDDTLLVVMGDHGMDAKGDHGGESDDEIEAALWMYNKKGLFGRTSDASKLPPLTAKQRPVAQIDIVPTLSLLLGMPIPFNNLGAPIKEAFIGPKGNDFRNLAVVNRLAAAQIHRYQHEYAQARGLSDESRASSLSLWREASDTWAANEKMLLSSAKDWNSIFSSYSRYQKETLRICRDLWARFDVTSMLNGVTILALGLGVLLVYARGIEGDRTELTPALLLRASIGTAFGASIGTLLVFLIPQLPFVHTAVYCTALGGILGAVTGFFYIQRRILLPLPRSIWAFVSVLFPIALSAGFAANSFTIWEDEILLFFITSFGALMFVSSLRQSSEVDRTLGCWHSAAFVVLTRVASLSRLCREEQMPFCKSTYYASANSSTSAVWQLAIPFVLSFVLPAIIKSYYQSTRSYQFPGVIMIGFILRVGLCLAALFWSLDAADDGDWFGTDQPWLKTVKVVVSQLTLGLAFGAGYSTFAWAAPLLSIQTERKSKVEKEYLEPSEAQAAVASEGGSSQITILGYANVHGTRYFLVYVVWLLAIVLMQKPMGGGAIGILTYQILSLLEIIDTNQLADTPVGPILLALLGSFHFFKTGHQPTLSSIQWESAFIPLKTIRYPWSPILVILNTFGAQILCAIAVPATVLWKQKPKEKGLLGNVAKATATHLLFHAVINLATTMWAGHLRRHLMLYRIFSPRFMTGAVVLLVVDVVAVFVGLGATRWSFLSVASVFGWS